MTNETSSLALPTQQTLVTPLSLLPLRQEIASQQKSTIAVLSNWQELANPTHCLWLCPHQEIVEQKPTIAFPNVEQCLLLVGTKDNTDFFGHFSPLTAGFTGSAIGQVIRAIDTEQEAVQAEESSVNKKVAIYTIAESDSPTGTTPSVAVEDFKKQFESVGYEVIPHTLSHEFFGKTLLWDTEKGIFEPSDNTYEVAPPPLGKYLSEKIFTEDG